MRPRPARQQTRTIRAAQVAALVLGLVVVVACSAAPTPVAVPAPQSAASSSATEGPVVRLSPLPSASTASPPAVPTETLPSGVPPLSLPPTGYPSSADVTHAPASTAPMTSTSATPAPTTAKPAPAANTTSAKSSPPPPAGPAASMTPVAVATGWLVAYRQASWTQPVTAWIARVRPYVTDKLYRSYLPLVGKGGGADWRAFVAGKCTATPGQVGGVVPPEAPHSANQVFVQVGGTLHTTCTAGPPPPDEPLAATLTLLHTPAGWRVDARQY